jgi:phosphoenolpyruvate carboxylase
VAASGTFKVTQQGEVITARYADRRLAARHLEQMVQSVLARVLSPSSGPVDPAWVEIMDALSVTSLLAYTELVKGTEGFLDLFRQMTPFPELATLNLASRPVSRWSADARSASIDDLRAIPWVFSWTQARTNLPGWYGLGTALQSAIDSGRLEALRAMYQGWTFFAAAIDNAQLSLGTADMLTARQYASLADNELLFARVEHEFQRTVDTVLAVTGQPALLGEGSLLARSIRLRNPYVDALHLAQITLLRRIRACPEHASDSERETLLDAIHHSINGIAAGLQTAG